jgi:hypothetical protein
MLKKPEYEVIIEEKEIDVEFESDEHDVVEDEFSSLKLIEIYS